jgi:ABC-type uncharacterized transport system permease subunit
MPNNGQIGLLIGAVVMFALAGVMSFSRLWKDTNAARLASKVCLYWGLLAAIGVLVWHGSTRGGWMPIGDNFDALIWLGVLLAFFVIYVQRTGSLKALDWFILPVIVLLLICAAVFGRVEYQRYVNQAWMNIHLFSCFAGAAGFAVAAASGAMYVLASARLRNKQASGNYLASLERLEHLTMTAVTLGFALLTIGIITGLIGLIGQGKPTQPAKVILAGVVWVIYAIVLHAPINPVFRGRRAALLSVVGFVLMVAALVVAQFGPGGR